MKIKVRIALEANAAGDWAAYGFPDGKEWDDVMDAFEALDAGQRFWIEAEVEVAEQPTTIQATEVRAAK
jgi:hypothetical protein